jgi:hypothetical protein
MSIQTIFEVRTAKNCLRLRPPPPQWAFTRTKLPVEIYIAAGTMDQ